MLAGGLLGNGEVAFMANGVADHECSAGLPVSVNALGGLAWIEKQRGVGRPRNSREKALYEGLRRGSAVYVAVNVTRERLCPDREIQEDARTVDWKDSAGTRARPLGGPENQM